MSFTQKEPCEGYKHICDYNIVLTKSIETGRDGLEGYYFMKISSNPPILEVTGKEKIENMFKVVFPSEEEAKKVEKAFRHLNIYLLVQAIMRLQMIDYNMFPNFFYIHFFDGITNITMQQNTRKSVNDT